ncbi:transposase [Conexibacter sp. S30A1]|uniref:transposase n=1 Tax=Conexibacter sp. S30A1 TaxID=2937800 RepID=UPI00200E8925|nr:transposase [Conexibacter sp. S30A1]
MIGLDIGEVESGAFWLEFLRSLKQRGLQGVQLVISDQYEGLKAGDRPDDELPVTALHGAFHQGYGDALPSRPAKPRRLSFAGALLAEQNDEWALSRRYLSFESIALVLATPADTATEPTVQELPVAA